MLTYIGIGSNLCDPIAQVTQAMAALAHLPQTTWVRGSQLYRSAPEGGPPDQPDYINAVAALDTQLDPWALFMALQAIEQSQGRVRTVRWGPRTIDLDVLLYGDVVRTDRALTIPHPRLHERLFVLIPLREIAPLRTIPHYGALDPWIARCTGTVHPL